MCTPATALVCHCSSFQPGEARPKGNAALWAVHRLVPDLSTLFSAAICPENPKCCEYHEDCLLKKWKHVRLLYAVKVMAPS